MKFYSIMALLFCFGCKSAQVEKIAVDKIKIENRLNYLSFKMEKYLDKLPVDSMAIPRALDAEGTLISSPAKQWTSGFFPGVLWQLYAVKKSKKLELAAKKWTSFIEMQKYDTHTHDLGFKINSSFGKGYEMQKDVHYKDVIVQASKTLIQRFNPKVGAIRSWDWGGDKWQFPVIIDNMMNLEMLFDATDFTGDSTYYRVAYIHAMTTLKNHYRKDASCYHVIDYDTLSGNVLNRNTHQGYSHESAWSRGQAWGLYGFSQAYARTGEKAFLVQAIKIADYFFNHPNMPKDLIPYWDFDAPNIPTEPRDVSAATVAASGLLQLMKFDTANKDKYMAWVDRIIFSLEYPQYQSNVVPFLLSQSTGSVPGNFEVNVPIIYGDYYYVETLLKRLRYF